MIAKLSDTEKLALFELLRDELQLKSITDFNRSIGKCYNAKIPKEKLKTCIGKTIYIVSHEN